MRFVLHGCSSKNLCFNLTFGNLLLVIKNLGNKTLAFLKSLHMTGRNQNQNLPGKCALH